MHDAERGPRCKAVRASRTSAHFYCYRVCARKDWRTETLESCAAQASMLTQLAQGKDVKRRMPFDLSDLPQHRGRENFAEEKHAVHEFLKALRAPATTYRQQKDDLDSKIALVKRIAAQKKAASSSNLGLRGLPRRSAGPWGQAYFVGAQTQRPHWH